MATIYLMFQSKFISSNWFFPINLYKKFGFLICLGYFSLVLYIFQYSYECKSSPYSLVVVGIWEKYWFGRFWHIYLIPYHFLNIILILRIFQLMLLYYLGPYRSVVYGYWTFCVVLSMAEFEDKLAGCLVALRVEFILKLQIALQDNMRFGGLLKWGQGLNKAVLECQTNWPVFQGGPYPFLNWMVCHPWWIPRVWALLDSG